MFKLKSLVGPGLNEPLWDKSLIGVALNDLKITKPITFYRSRSCLNLKSLVGFGLNEPLWDKSLAGFALNRLKIARHIVFYNVFLKCSSIMGGVNKTLRYFCPNGAHLSQNVRDKEHFDRLRGLSDLFPGGTPLALLLTQ